MCGVGWEGSQRPGNSRGQGYRYVDGYLYGVLYGSQHPLFPKNSPAPKNGTVRKNHERKNPVMKIEITLFDQAEENPTGEVIDLAFTEHGYLSAETVRSIVQSTAGRVVLQEVSLGLLEQPWFWSVALATGAEEVKLVLVEGESLGWVKESLKRVSSVAQEVRLGVEVGLA